VHYVTFPQETQRKEELLCVRADGANIQTNIFAEALNYITQIHTVWLVETLAPHWKG
jgi:hypothetical protein